jgi:hypothetical protein
MKTLGTKSLSSILARIIGIFWWLEWIGLVTVVTVVIAAAVTRKAFAIAVPVTFSNITIRQVQPLNKDFPAATLNTTSGNLYLHADASLFSVVMLLIAFGLLFTLVLTVTYQLKIIFSNFKQNVPFNEVNIYRIRNIAFVLICYSVAQWLYVAIMNRVLISNLQWEHMQLTYSFNFSWLLTGIALVVVAEIFKQGTLLENEQKLTI